MSDNDGHVSKVVGVGRFAMPGPEYFQNAERLLAEDQQAASDRSRESRTRALKDAGVPEPHIAGLLGGNMDQSPAVLEVGKFLASAKSIMLICGSRGVGKSFAAASALDPDGGLYMRAATFARLSDYDKDAFAAIETARVLVLDDLGMEYSDKHEFFLTRFDDLISSRYDSQRCTILTTNMSVQAFKDRYGGRVVDRIREVGMVCVVSGESRRGK